MQSSFSARSFKSTQKVILVFIDMNLQLSVENEEMIIMQGVLYRENVEKGPGNLGIRLLFH